MHFKSLSVEVRGVTVRHLVGVSVLGIALGLGRGAIGQAPAPNDEQAETKGSSKREQELEQRLKRLEERYEAMERRNAESQDTLQRRYDELLKKVGSAEAQHSKDDKVVPNAAQAKPDDPPANGSAPEALPTPAPPDASLPALIPDNFGEGAEDTPGPFIPPAPKPSGPSRLPLSGVFSRGFIFETKDDEFQLQIRYLGQIDYRQYTRPNQDPVHSGFSFPRERIYFTGRVTKPLEYFLTIQRSYGNMDLLDAYVNFHYDDRLQVKVGRYKTPYSYEFYAMSAGDLPLPERSLFNSNFAPNRQMGIMAWGQLLEKRLDYAVGMFNGNRFSFQDTNEEKDVIAYMNIRPFEKAGESWDWLRFLNLGGSVAFGNEFSVPPQPAVLRTSLAASNGADSINIAPPFLAYNRTVIESGTRSLWGAHAAYFYKGLTLMGEWTSGYETFKASEKSGRTQVPLDGYYATIGYFLTGEKLERRAPVKPLKPFKVGKGETGTGAIEVVSRFSALSLGADVFTGGLANPKNWTSSLSTLDLGFNWYLTENVKCAFVWERAMFATPVLYRPDATQSTSDLFWMRVQVYF